MPDDTEDVFAGLGLSLFPAAARELSLDCSCPDHAVPCKHLAATFYQALYGPNPRSGAANASADGHPPCGVGTNG